jgi:hypothetical protein
LVGRDLSQPRLACILFKERGVKPPQTKAATGRRTPKKLTDGSEGSETPPAGKRGEFAPGFPFAYVADPDGYEIEIWFE